MSLESFYKDFRMHFLKLEPRILLANLAPYVVNPIPDQHVTQGDPVTINVSGTFKDPDGDPLTYWSFPNKGQLPAWLTLDQSAGVFSGSTSGVATGVYAVTVSATDPSFKGVATTFKIFVDPNLPPRINKSPANQTAWEDQAFSFQLPADTFMDPEGKALTYWSFPNKGQMPAWMSFDQGSRTFSGTPDQSDVGVATITVSATDPSYKGAATTFKVTIQNTNDPPIVSAAIPSQIVNQRQAFRLTIPSGTFSDPDGDPLSLSLSGSPPWLSLSGGIISGTPTAETDCHPWNVGIKASDPSGSVAEAVFLLTVNNVNDPPYLAKPIPDQDIHVGQEFRFTVPAGTFTDPEGKSLTYWSFPNKGQMPAWMSFDQTSGTFSGTPSDQTDVGIHTITVSATDPSYKGIATTFKITVKDIPENKPPQIIDFPDTIIWTPGTRPTAISGTSLIVYDPDSSDFNGGFLEIDLNPDMNGDYIYCPPISSGFGDITRYDNTHLKINLHEMSFPVEVNKLMYQITYSNTLDDPPPGVRELVIIMNDGDGGETKIV